MSGDGARMSACATSEVVPIASYGKTLASRGPMHGYAITLHVEQISDNALRLEEGSLYPALHRMTQAGWLSAEWDAIVRGGREEELQFHIDARARDNVRAGMNASEARENAVQRFGNRTLAKETDARLGYIHGA